MPKQNNDFEWLGASAHKLQTPPEQMNMSFTYTSECIKELLTDEDVDEEIIEAVMQHIQTLQKDCIFLLEDNSDGAY